jgi:glutathione S-transferase
MDSVEDYFQVYFKFFFEQNEEKKAVAKTAWLNQLPIWVRAIEHRIKENGEKYVAGDKITTADFAVAAILFNLLLNKANPNYEEAYHHVKDHHHLISYS